MNDALAAVPGFELFGVPLEFALFALTLLGVALLHHRTLAVALIGLAAIVLYKLMFTGFHAGAGLLGLTHHLAAEWVVLGNLFGLLMGFALLSRHYEQSHVPAKLPDYLPDDWRGGFLLLVMVFVLSSFLDNIAAALIGGTVAATVFRHKVHIGYIAALVAAANAGGSGSVVGDTTTQRCSNIGSRRSSSRAASAGPSTGAVSRPPHGAGQTGPCCRRLFADPCSCCRSCWRRR